VVAHLLVSAEGPLGFPRVAQGSHQVRIFGKLLPRHVVRFYFTPSDLVNVTANISAILQLYLEV
jgi:hypothetical protein